MKLLMKSFNIVIILNNENTENCLKIWNKTRLYDEYRSSEYGTQYRGLT